MPKGLLQVNNFFLDEESAVWKIVSSQIQKRESRRNNFFMRLTVAPIDNM